MDRNREGSRREAHEKSNSEKQKLRRDAEKENKKAPVALGAAGDTCGGAEVN